MKNISFNAKLLLLVSMLLITNLHGDLIEKKLIHRDKIFIICNIQGDKINGVYILDGDGSIHIENIGKIFLLGKTVEDAQDEIWKQIFGKNKLFSEKGGISIMVGRYVPYQPKK